MISIEKNITTFIIKINLSHKLKDNFMLKLALSTFVLSLTPALAATLTVKLSVSPSTAEHLATALVDNCWADTTNYPSTNYQIIVGEVANVATEDMPALKAAAEAWIQSHKAELTDVKLAITDAETDQTKVYVRGHYIMNQFFKLRDSLQTALSCAPTTTGTRHVLATNHKGRFAAHIPVAEVTKEYSKRAHKAVHLIATRIRQNDVIYPNSHFEISLTNPAVTVSK